MEIEVTIGNFRVTKNPDILTASGIGSCVVITLFDYKHKIGALAHAMLADHIPSQIDEILKKMYSLGSNREYIEAKLVGGANMFPELISDIGKNNVLTAKEKLQKEGIKLVSESVGGSIGRYVEFCTSSGFVRGEGF